MAGDYDRAVMILAAAVLAATLAKPAIVFHRPPECSTFCDRFAEVVAHPAMQRRLANVAFETREAPSASLSVHDPAGREVMRWIGLPDRLMLADVLTLVELARPHVMAAHEASDPRVAEREWVLAVLAFGDRTRGRELLSAMKSSESHENRQLAAIWLERLETVPREKVFAGLARTAATARVRTEALMALGDLKLNQHDFEGAIAAYDRAVEAAPARSNSRQNALEARQRAIAMATPVLGLGPPGAVVSGRKTIQPRDLPHGVARVEFRLDGKLVATARRAPFAAGVFFGKLPARQVLEITARNRGGHVLEKSSVVINERGDAFAVEFLQPASHELSGAVEVVLDARVPRGRSVEELEVEWNGRRVARITTPPYRARVQIPEGELGVLRAVLRLDDGSGVEDALVAGASGIEASAHIVEVPVYFDEPNPSPRDVVIREAGQPRTVERIIRPADAPLLIALLIDTSSSMKDSMLDVQEAAVRFIEENIEPRDAAMVVGFSHAARVLQRPARDVEVLKRSILALRPRGATALYDAIITALLQLQQTGSRRALVVFSDGFDVSSIFSSDDAAEVARRAGVPIYVLMLTPEGELRAEAVLARQGLTGISEQSGARVFELRALDDLGAFWNQIGEDLRRQSLLIYRTDTAGAEWRPLEVSVTGRGPVRAPSGVFVTSE
jgi:VWFA-related protein